MAKHFKPRRRTSGEKLVGPIILNVVAVAMLLMILGFYLKTQFVLPEAMTPQMQEQTTSSAADPAPPTEPPVDLPVFNE